jgi:hypothetical protein
VIGFVLVCEGDALGNGSDVRDLACDPRFRGENEALFFRLVGVLGRRWNGMVKGSGGWSLLAVSECCFVVVTDMSDGGRIDARVDDPC